MAKIPKIIPVTDLRHDAAAVLKRLQSSHQPLVITQRGRAAAVLVSIEDYDRSQHERELLRLLAKGEQEISKARDTLWKRFSRRRIRFSRVTDLENTIHPFGSTSVFGSFGLYQAR